MKHGPLTYFKAIIVKFSGERRIIEIPKIEYEDFNIGDKVVVVPYDQIKDILNRKG